ncbi:MAG TPA: SDR family NAD(P)-dependent oxidoreductase, partial [Phycisphaerae bacterium]|nr:SDR family NAD(P)-dependent oxidoreductase [Phycisphaerae bacterium]
MTKKRALVTGGSGPIGAAIAARLAADGYAVVVHGHRHGESAERVAEKIRVHGGSARSVSLDITDESATRQAMESLLKDGPIQLVVNNAGLHDDAPMAGMTGAQWTKVIDVSL